MTVPGAYRPGGGPAAGPWSARAEQAQAVLRDRYGNRWPWQGWPGTFRARSPAGLDDRLVVHYWWQAHALDVLVDAQLRAPAADTVRRVERLVAGVRRANRNSLENDFYDDMGWMALALLRAAGMPGRGGSAPTDDAAAAARQLWTVVRGGWNPGRGGGVAWRRSQPDYKNVPANGPAAMLAARLHARDGDPDDLAWALRITDWVDRTLVDPTTRVVWDGVGRRGDDHVDGADGEDGWVFTYTHGVVLAAHADLYALTGDERHAVRVRETVGVVLDRLAPDGVLQDEGPGDGALFRAVLVRSLGDVLVRGVAGARSAEVVALLERCGAAAWAARDTAGRFGPSWRSAPEGGSELSAHLSGVALTEQLARLEATGLLG